METFGHYCTSQDTRSTSLQLEAKASPTNTEARMSHWKLQKSPRRQWRSSEESISKEHSTARRTRRVQNENTWRQLPSSLPGLQLSMLSNTGYTPTYATPEKIDRT